MSIFVLIFLIGPLPAPTYMFLDTFASLKECQAAIAGHKSDEMRERLNCIQLVPAKTKEA